jgi:nucleoside-diphosphate-sugar epimerase
MTAGEQVRDYLYVDDAAEAFLRSIETPSAQGVYNLASGKGVSLRVLVEKVRDLVDPDVALRLGELPYREDQSMNIVGDTSRLRSDTGWQPRTPLDEGLTLTVQALTDGRRPVAPPRP